MESKSVFESMRYFLNEHTNGVITIETDFLGSYSWPMMKIHLSVGNRNVCRFISLDADEVLVDVDDALKHTFKDMCDTIDKMEDRE